MANCIRSLADSVLLPHDFVRYGEAIKRAAQTSNYGDFIDDINEELKKVFIKDEDYEELEINLNQMTEDLKKHVELFIKEAIIWNRSLDSKSRQSMFHNVIKHTMTITFSIYLQCFFIIILFLHEHFRKFL